MKVKGYDICPTADLQDANLQGADLQDADLQDADLQDADLQGANLQGANLRGADLRNVNLWGTNLQGADLQGADLQGAWLPAPTMVLLAKWGQLSPELTIDLMAYDASNHPNPSAFTRWTIDETCPYANCSVQRAANFQEDSGLWSPDHPVRSAYELMVDVLKEKTV